MRRYALIPPLLVCLAYLPFRPEPTQSATPDSKAMDALKQSYAIGSAFEGHERISYLVRLTRNSADIAPELTKRWCEELFKLASESPLDWDHVANQKNAAVPLAKIDPKRAMELLAGVDLPQPKDGEFPEDVRADAAANIFPWFWRAYREEGLAQIERQAGDIGDSGEYPYRAMAFVVDELMSLHRDDATAQANAIFRNALGYYKTHSKFQDEEEEFLDLLESGRHISSPDAYREALELFIKHVTVPRNDKGLFAANIRTSGGVVWVNDQNKQLLLRVFPILADFDHAWAEKLAAENPGLKIAEGGVQPLGGAFIPGNPSKEYAAQRHRQLLEMALLPRIENLRETNPQAAVQLAESLTTRPARTVAFSAVLPGIMRSDPLAAKQVYAQQLRDLQDVEQPLDHLKALVAVAKSAYYVQDLPRFTQLANEILDTGTLLFENDSKRSRADARRGYREMTEIVAFGSMHRVNWIIDRVGKTDDRFLKAHLLIFVAKGLAEAERDLELSAAPPRR